MRYEFTEYIKVHSHVSCSHELVVKKDSSTQVSYVCIYINGYK